MNRRKKRYLRAKKKHLGWWHIRQYYDLGWHRELAKLCLRASKKKRGNKRNRVEILLSEIYDMEIEDFKLNIMRLE